MTLNEFCDHMQREHYDRISSGTLPTRRCQNLKISEELASELISGGVGNLISRTGLPQDAKIVAVGTENNDFINGVLTFRIYHESFPVVPEGCAAPQIQVTIRDKAVKFREFL